MLARFGGGKDRVLSCGQNRSKLDRGARKERRLRSSKGIMFWFGNSRHSGGWSFLEATVSFMHFPQGRSPRAAMPCSPPSLRLGDGSTTSGSGELPPSPRSPSVKARANDTFVCWHPLPSYRLASSQRSSMEARLRISRSPASPRCCRIRGPSRSGASAPAIILLRGCGLDTSAAARNQMCGPANWLPSPRA
jgi:hypothetical protein